MYNIYLYICIISIYKFAGTRCDYPDGADEAEPTKGLRAAGQADGGSLSKGWKEGGQDRQRDRLMETDKDRQTQNSDKRTTTDRWTEKI